MAHANDSTGAFRDAETMGIELDFPGWRVWRSRDHLGQPAAWWASRRHSAVWAEPQTVAGDTEDELRTELAGASAGTVSQAL